MGIKKRPVLIHEVHDLWPKTLIEIGGMKKNSPFVWLMQRGENESYKSADYVASTLEFAEPHMKRHGLKSGKFVYIPNGISMADWELGESIPEKHKYVLDRIKHEQKFIVGYFGGFAISNALDRLIDAAQLIKNEKIVFVLVGKGSEKKRLYERVKNENIKNVIFLEPVSKKSIPNLLKYFDCVYMGIEKDLEIYKYGISFTKMYDSMMGGCPIVISMSDVTTPIETFQCGLKTAVDKYKLEKCIEQMYAMSKKDRSRMGENGKAAVIKHYEYERLAEKYEALFPPKTATILLINHYAGSSKMGMDFRPYYLAKEWIKKGYNVKILAAEYSHLRRENPCVAKDFQKQMIDGVEYCWIKTRKYEGNGLKRALTMFQFVGKLCINAKKIAHVMEPDVIITASTYPLDIYAAKRIKKHALEMRERVKNE
ncbi:glycosyltransferase [[Clostridium] hylemonae]|uniref:glycosyltransferase n=1 Tax=[Clostridium] hylemonae TaxID=89153 RepID=UPI0011067480|nr:glycosyltransferase [[Clostridium] hylemonae]